MVDRRSMGDALALTPDKLAFIHGEKAVVETGRGAEKIQAPDRSLDKAEPAHQEPGPSRARIRRPGRRPKVAPPEALPAAENLDRTFPGDFPPLLVSLTTRLSPATADALRRAALELRLQRRRPHTQQEIIEAAVRHWLATNGFLRAA
jgi:hypothetical protein